MTFVKELRVKVNGDFAPAFTVLSAMKYSTSEDGTKLHIFEVAQSTSDMLSVVEERISSR